MDATTGDATSTVPQAAPEHHADLATELNTLARLSSMTAANHDAEVLALAARSPMPLLRYVGARVQDRVLSMIAVAASATTTCANEVQAGHAEHAKHADT